LFGRATKVVWGQLNLAAMVYLHTKFEFSIFNHYGDMKGNAILQNVENGVFGG